MGVSLNGGTPQNTAKWSFLVGYPWLLGTTIFGKPQYVSLQLQKFLYPSSCHILPKMPSISLCDIMRNTSWLKKDEILKSWIHILNELVPLCCGIPWNTSWLYNRDPHLMAYELIPI